MKKLAIVLALILVAYKKEKTSATPNQSCTDV
jgi:hypothetical protein